VDEFAEEDNAEDQVDFDHALDEQGERCGQEGGEAGGGMKRVLTTESQRTQRIQMDFFVSWCLRG
jgi:hypothetical protein